MPPPNGKLHVCATKSKEIEAQKICDRQQGGEVMFRQRISVVETYHVDCRKNSETNASPQTGRNIRFRPMVAATILLGVVPIFIRKRLRLAYRQFHRVEIMEVAIDPEVSPSSK